MATVDDVHAGLSASPKKLPHALCIGGNSGELFAEMRSHPDYYVYQCDLELCATAAKNLKPFVKKDTVFAEFSCGLCDKSVPFLKEIKDISTFVAVDLNPVVLGDGKNLLQKEFSQLNIITQVGDLVSPCDLPVTGKSTVGLLAGSMLHTFAKDAAVVVIRNCLNALGDGGILLVTFDTNTDPAASLKAYTTEPCSKLLLNALVMANAKYGANFDLDQFKHVSIYNAENKTVYHYVEAQSPQVVKVDSKEYAFETGERVLILHCFKRSVEEVVGYAKIAGGVVKKTDFDQQGFLCLAWIEKET